MQVGTFALILVSVTLSALAQTSFKYGMTAVPGIAPSFRAALMTPGVIGGLGLYGVGTLLWLRVLSKTDLSQAYPFVGLGFVITAVIGALAFGEVVSPARSVGIILVMIGIIVIARS